VPACSNARKTAYECRVEAGGVTPTQESWAAPGHAQASHAQTPVAQPRQWKPWLRRDVAQVLFNVLNVSF